MKFFVVFVLVVSAAFETQAFFSSGTGTGSRETGKGAATEIPGNFLPGSVFATVTALGIDIPDLTEDLNINGSIRLDPIDALGSVISHLASTLGRALNTISSHVLNPIGTSANLNVDTFVTDVITDFCKATFSIIMKAELKILNFDDITIVKVLYPIVSNLGVIVKCIPGGLYIDVNYPAGILRNNLSQYIPSSSILAIESAVNQIVYTTRKCAL